MFGLIVRHSLSLSPLYPDQLSSTPFIFAILQWLELCVSDEENEEKVCPAEFAHAESICALFYFISISCI